MAILAFHCDSSRKSFFLARIRQHIEAGDVLQTRPCYNKVNRTGSASGITIHSNCPEDYELELGIPGVLAQLEDVLGSAMSAERAAVWPEEFLAAISVGADLTGVWAKFVEKLLGDTDAGVISKAENDEQRAAIKQVVDLYKLLPGLIKLFVEAGDFANQQVTGDSSSTGVAAINAVNTSVGAAQAALKSFGRQDILWVDQITQAAAAAVSGNDFQSRASAYNNMADMLLDLLKAA